MSTVVGVATGMFTLRDEVWPDQSGTAQAVDVSAYRVRVGRICDDLNTSQRANHKEDRQLAGRLARARTALAQRNVLLDAARRSVARSSDTLAAFSALEAPRSAATVHRRAAADWRRNVERVTLYAERLDRARDRRGVVAAVEHLSRQRSALARDALSVRSGLQELGGDSCDIERPSVSKTVTLPAAPTPRPSPSPHPTATGTGTPTPTATAGPDEPIDPRVNTPHPNQPAPTPPPAPSVTSEE